MSARCPDCRCERTSHFVSGLKSANKRHHSTISSAATSLRDWNAVRIAALVVEHFKNLRDTRPNDIVSDGIAERTRPIVQDIDAGLQAYKQARGIARGAEPHPFLTEITIDTASLAGKVSFKASSSRRSSARFEFEFRPTRWKFGPRDFSAKCQGSRMSALEVRSSFSSYRQLG